MPEVKGQGGGHGMLAPGWNPKDTPETFVSKIMDSRKRIDQTIARYEQDLLAKQQTAQSSPVQESDTERKLAAA